MNVEVPNFSRINDTHFFCSSYTVPIIQIFYINEKLEIVSDWFIDVSDFINPDRGFTMSNYIMPSQKYILVPIVNYGMDAYTFIKVDMNGTQIIGVNSDCKGFQVPPI